LAVYVFGVSQCKKEFHEVTQRGTKFHKGFFFFQSVILNLFQNLSVNRVSA
jgi:hypothetical protein